MLKNLLRFSVLGVALSTLLYAAPANAQATRTWVSGVGDDANPCSRTAPCKTFAGAISKTAANGEIDCLDPGGFGAVTITKSITLDCTGTFGSVLVSGTNGIIVNAAGGTVRLRGISIFGVGTGLNGINVIAGSLIVEQSVIGEFTQSGILVSTSANSNVLMNDVTIRASGIASVTLGTSSGQVVAQLNNVRLDGAPTGLTATNHVRVNMRDVTIAHNSTGMSTSGTDNIINADNVMVSFAGTGVQSSSGSTVRLSNSVITQNATGLNPNSGAIVSMAGNSVTGNTTDGAFTSTVGKL